MKYLIYILLIVVLFLSSCIPKFLDEDEEPEKLFLKKIEMPDFKLEWYYHSLITSTTSDYVVLTKNNRTDTICVSDNIHDVNVFNADTIELFFYGQPCNNLKSINIEKEILGCCIIVDTTANQGELKHRKSFKN